MCARRSGTRRYIFDSACLCGGRFDLVLRSGAARSRVGGLRRFDGSGRCFRTGVPALRGWAATSSNSLRARRPLRSNSDDEHVHVARKRAGRPTAQRRHSRLIEAPQPAHTRPCWTRGWRTTCSINHRREGAVGGARWRAAIKLLRLRCWMRGRARLRATSTCSRHLFERRDQQIAKRVVARRPLIQQRSEVPATPGPHSCGTPPGAACRARARDQSTPAPPARPQW